MKKIVIIGATSAIAKATAREYAKQGNEFFLVARNSERLKTVADDLTARGAAKTDCFVADLNELDLQQNLVEAAVASLGRIDIALLAHGTLGNEKACQQSVDPTLLELNTNAVSHVTLLTRLANILEQQKHGTLAVISSVAGDRGRQSNYVYGSAKAMVSTFLQGLRNRLAKSDVQVLTIKPGFVDTPMTADFPKGVLWVQPETIAKGIVLAIDKGRNIVYLPFYWRYIMLIIRHIPEFIFKRLSL